MSGTSWSRIRTSAAQHCEIRHVGYDYFLIDLDSTNGISVNGRPVTRHALANGDVITMGATQIRVEVS